MKKATLEAATVLICEDGDEYRDNLVAFLSGPRYLQAKHLEAALDVLAHEPIDIIVMDVCFDRVAHQHLCGDIEEVLREFNGNRAAAWHHLARYQGLYLVAALRQAGFDQPVVLAYDFAAELPRFHRLQRQHGGLAYLPENAGIEEIEAILLSCMGAAGDRASLDQCDSSGGA